MSRYMGVPYRTYIKWEHGQRAPGAVATRLLDILELVQANAPALHDDLLTEARQR
jgi:DNA-binding transcriptional regulator YiaG